MQIIKRNGQIVLFDKQKIVNAINKALIEVDGILYETDTAEDIALEIEEIVKKSSMMTVENIQDLVEEFLMVSERKDVARAYIRYRYKKEVARENSSEFRRAIIDKLLATNIQNQNANVDEHSFGGRMGEASSVMTKQLALDEIVSPMAKENHLNNMIYIHDLDHYYLGDHNCLSIPFDDLLANGFVTRQTSVRPAQSVDTAFQLLAVIFQLQSLNQFGGVSATHLDWTMVPYVRKSYYKHIKTGLKYFSNKTDYNEFCCEYEKIKKETKVTMYNSDWSDYTDITIPKQVQKYAINETIKEIYKAADGMLHNLNTLQSRSGEFNCPLR